MRRVGGIRAWNELKAIIGTEQGMARTTVMNTFNEARQRMNASTVLSNGACSLLDYGDVRLPNNICIKNVSQTTS